METTKEYITGSTGWIKARPLTKDDEGNELGYPDGHDWRIVAPDGKVLMWSWARTREDALKLVKENLYHQLTAWEKVV